MSKTNTTPEKERTTKKKKIYNRQTILLRFIVVAILIVVFASFIVVKAFNTTILHSEDWNAKAMKTFSDTTIDYPGRGDILADDGSVLATTQVRYSVWIDYRAEKFMTDTFVAKLPIISDSLAHYYPRRTAKQWHQYLLEPLSREKKPRGHLLVKNITFTDLQKMRTWPFFKIKNANRNGFAAHSFLKRCYPYGELVKRSIGRVNEDSVTGEIHGYSGLEYAIDSLLYGVNGINRKVPLTKNVVDMPSIPAIDGYNVRTTINVGMQDILENELGTMLQTCGGDWGTAVLMETATGDIKAISNLDYDHKTRRVYEAMNRAVLCYEPGSVVKAVSLTIALEDKLVRDSSEVIPIGQSFPYAGGRAITDSHFMPSLRVSEILEHSSNIGTTRVMVRGFGEHPSEYRKRLASMGFFEPFNIGIRGEQTPRFPIVADNKGGRIAFSRQTYGYNSEISPMSILAFYNALANDGKYVRPRLVKGIEGNGIDSVIPVSYIRDSICSRETASKMRGMLTKVVEGKSGTARRLRLMGDYKVRIAGKTGTCYIVEGKRYNMAKRRVSFVGFFPADNPKYSCVVVVSNPKSPRGAASVSGEVLKGVANKLYARGLLDNSSDYRVNVDPKSEKTPTFYASMRSNNANDEMLKDLSINSIKRFERPKTDSVGVVPNVVGLGLREAISQLETVGLNVEISGVGYVKSQTPKAGEKLEPGTKVVLSLVE